MISPGISRKIIPSFNNEDLEFSIFRETVCKDAASSSTADDNYVIHDCGHLLELGMEFERDVETGRKIVGCLII